MNGYRLLGVRLKATVCVRSGQEALKVYPSEIGVTHFVVTSSRKRWRAVRLTRDRAPWLVPLGETWNGRACGPVVIDDPIPPTHYGVESLGNPQSCYGTALSLTVMRRTATKRTVVRCGGVG